VTIQIPGDTMTVKAVGEEGVQMIQPMTQVSVSFLLFLKHKRDSLSAVFRHQKSSLPSQGEFSQEICPFNKSLAQQEKLILTDVCPQLEAIIFQNNANDIDT